MPIVTLDSMRKNQKKAADSDEDEGGNEYFTGGLGQGGSGSGLAVLAPTDRGGDPLRQMMSRLQSEQAQAGGQVAPNPDRRMVTVTVYRNGFTVNDGPLRSHADPENRTFMQNLVEGYCPPELVENGQPADVKLENKVDEDYNPNSSGGRGGGGSSFSAFGGTGAAVGDIALQATPLIVPGTQGNGAPLIVDETSGDVIRVQIKFPDGSREVAKFNKNHTVRHLIARIELLRTNLRPYHLLSGNRGPPKPLEPSQYDYMLVDAGLAGALVTVKESP